MKLYARPVDPTTPCECQNYARLTADNARLAAENKALAAQVEKMREALARIVVYAPKQEPLRLDNDACDECKRRREQKWPPSGLCEKHYGVQAANLDRNERLRAYQHADLRDIASKALAALSPVAPEKTCDEKPCDCPDEGTGLCRHLRPDNLAASRNAPGHTDLMISPEAIDAAIMRDPPASEKTCGTCGGDGQGDGRYLDSSPRECRTCGGSGMVPDCTKPAPAEQTPEHPHTRLLREVAESGVVFIDKTADFVTVQIDRDTWDAIKALADAGEKK
jgi:hypothetical protein